ncbi:MAG TPA: cytochrome c [Candidatus Obscuribacterales bacterium]
MNNFRHTDLAVAAVVGSAVLLLGFQASATLDETFVQIAEARPSAPAKPRKDLSSGTASAEGKRLFSQFKCAGCHIAGGSGGCLGPPLDGVSKRRSKTFILSRITDTEAQKKRFADLYAGQAELMPHPRVAPGQAETITAYLLSLPEPRGGFVALAHGPAPRKGPSGKPDSRPPGSTASAGSVAHGRKLYFDLGCAACHSIGNVGGQFAPPLDGVARRRSRMSIADHITRGELQVGPTGGTGRPTRFMMPPADLPPEQIEHITDFLMTLPLRR